MVRILGHALWSPSSFSSPPPPATEGGRSSKGEIEHASAEMLAVLERIVSRRGESAATSPSVRAHCCSPHLPGVLMTKAFVIGLPVREAHTGTTLEMCHELVYDPAAAVPRWKKYVYSEEEAQEDAMGEDCRASVELLDAGPLDQQEHEALHAARDRLCAVFPAGAVRLRLM